VNAPIGAAVGGALGADVGTDIHDENKEAIDGAVHRAGQAWDDSIEAGLRRLDETARWISARNAKRAAR
jgi:hypothetical protein